MDRRTNLCVCAGVFFMKEIPVRNTGGEYLVALVDDENYEFLSKYKWKTHQPRPHMNCYAIAFIHEQRKYVPMHRLIMNTPDDLVVDHKDHNGLNNQKYNLRNCTSAQNAINKKKRTRGKSSSKYIGVNLDKKSKRWRCGVSYTINRKCITMHGGTFDKEIQAAVRYNQLARKVHGEFASLNDVSEYSFNERLFEAIQDFFKEELHFSSNEQDKAFIQYMFEELMKTLDCYQLITINVE